MSQRDFLAMLRVSALALAVPLAGCGNYAAEPEAAGGSTPTSGASPAMAGTASGSGGAAGGGAAGTGGAGGTGGRETPPEASCENVTACGGEVVGVWFATSSCLPISGIADLAGLGIGCTEAPASGELEVTGNWTVGADGSISDNTSTTGEVLLELEPPCLNVSGTVTTCDRVGAPLASAGFTDVTCVDSETTADGCTCTGTVNQTGAMGYVTFDASTKGTYATAANALTISAIKDVAYSYCVDGNFMIVTPTTPNITGITSGTVVFQKQP